MFRGNLLGTSKLSHFISAFLRLLILSLRFAIDLFRSEVLQRQLFQIVFIKILQKISGSRSHLIALRINFSIYCLGSFFHLKNTSSAAI